MRRPSQMHDRPAVEAARRDPRRFEALYRKYVAQVYSFALYELRRPPPRRGRDRAGLPARAGRPAALPRAGRRRPPAASACGCSRSRATLIANERRSAPAPTGGAARAGHRACRPATIPRPRSSARRVGRRVARRSTAARGAPPRAGAALRAGDEHGRDRRADEPQRGRRARARPSGVAQRRSEPAGARLMPGHEEEAAVHADAYIDALLRRPPSAGRLKPSPSPTHPPAEAPLPCCSSGLPRIHPVRVRGGLAARLRELAEGTRRRPAVGWPS
jgi:hypothetical protein